MIGALDPEEAASIELAIPLLSTPTLRPQIAAVHANYGMLPAMISELESEGLPLVRSLQILQNTVNFLDAGDGIIAQLIAQKLHSCLSKNPSINALQEIASIFSEENS